MIDVVERLRDNTHGGVSLLALEAAAEIELLRDAVQDVLCDPAFLADWLTIAKLQSVRGPAIPRKPAPGEVNACTGGSGGR